MMETMILVLFIASLTTQQVLSQDAANDKTDAAAAEAQAWNNRRNQHFTMHFGKRLEPQELPAGLMASPARAYDLYPVAEQHHQPPAIKFPYWLSIQLEHGQTLHAVPPSPLDEQDANAFWSPVPNRMPIYSFERPLAQTVKSYPSLAQRSQQQQQVARQQLEGQKLLKLISANEDDATATTDGQDANVERAQPSSNAQEDGKMINVNTRSPMQNQIKLPKHFIPVLFGAGSNFGSYNKKAEPKDNFFMHFGK